MMSNFFPLNRLSRRTSALKKAGGSQEKSCEEATSSAPSEISTAETRQPWSSRAIVQAMHPLPVQRSRTSAPSPMCLLQGLPTQQLCLWTRDEHIRSHPESPSVEPGLSGNILQRLFPGESLHTFHYHGDSLI